MNNFGLNLSKVASCLYYFGYSNLALSLLSVGKYASSWNEFLKSDCPTIGYSREAVNDYVRKLLNEHPHCIGFKSRGDIYQFKLELKSDDVSFCIQKNYDEYYTYNSLTQAIMKWEVLTNE